MTADSAMYLLRYSRFADEMPMSAKGRGGVRQMMLKETGVKPIVDTNEFTLTERAIFLAMAISVDCMYTKLTLPQSSISHKAMTERLEGSDSTSSKFEPRRAEPAACRIT